MQQLQQARAQEERQVSRHSLLASLLFPTYVHSLLECLGFTWYVLIVVPMFCPFHNMVCVHKDSPGSGHELPSLVFNIIHT